MAPARERSASRGPPPARMLRIEYKGQPYDWFNLDEMGDIVRTSDFSNTLRENIAHYFGVPFECQAVYDEEGMLSSVADFARALHSMRPWLRVHDIREMESELKDRTVQQLNAITAEVERSLRHLGAVPQPGIAPVESAYEAPGRVASQPSDAQSWPSPMTQKDSPVSLADAVRSANEERAMSASQPYASQMQGMGIPTGDAGNDIGSTAPGPGLYSIAFTQNGLGHSPAISAGAPGTGALAPASFGNAPSAAWTGPTTYGQPSSAFMNTFGSPPSTSAPWVHAPPTLNMPTLGSSGSNGNMYGMAAVSSAYTGSPVSQLSQPPVASGLGLPRLPSTTSIHQQQQQSLITAIGTSGLQGSAALPSGQPPMLGSAVGGSLLRQATPPPGSGTPPLSAFSAGSAPAAVAWPCGPLNGMASAALGSASRSASPAPAAVAGAGRPANALTSNGGFSLPSTAGVVVQAPMDAEVKSTGRSRHAGSAGKPLMRQLDVLLPEHRPQKADAPQELVAAGAGAGPAGDVEEAYDVIEVTISKDTSAGGERAQRFGFANVPTRDARALLISWVDQHGLLARWNRTFPEKAVSEGDRIVTVNNASDDVEAMRAELQTDTIHMLVHRRSSTAC
mmetsp:Transcript_142183/g.247812  ORF Transcript_142183/g.247812 Transcript_142183/m.247812 type:complete len:621 (-) Transcript_142183:108-1970(-)